MSPTWLIITILTALAIGITIAMAILTVGHQTEERPGYLDLTAIKPRRGYSWPQVSRVRAQAGGWDGFTSVRLVRDGVVVRSWWRPSPGEVVEVAPGEVFEFRDHADERWQTLSVVERSSGGEAA